MGDDGVSLFSLLLVGVTTIPSISNKYSDIEQLVMDRGNLFIMAVESCESKNHLFSEIT